MQVPEEVGLKAKKTSKCKSDPDASDPGAGLKTKLKEKRAIPKASSSQLFLDENEGNEDFEMPTSQPEGKKSKKASKAARKSVDKTRTPEAASVGIETENKRRKVSQAPLKLQSEGDVEVGKRKRKKRSRAADDSESINQKQD